MALTEHESADLEEKVPERVVDSQGLQKVEQELMLARPDLWKVKVAGESVVTFLDSGAVVNLVSEGFTDHLQQQYERVSIPITVCLADQ